MRTLLTRAALALAALLAWSAPSSAAVCKYNDLTNASLTHEVRVNPRGWDCDFKDLGSALGYVANQTRSITSVWHVKVKAATYTETAGITVPSYTFVEGEPDADSPSTTYLGQAKLTVTATTGALVTMGDFSSWEGIAVSPGATTMTGAIKTFDTTGVTATISETLITIPTGLADTQNVYGVYNGAAGVVTLNQVSFLSVGTRTKAWGAINLGESMDVWGGHWAGSASQVKMFENNSSGKTLRLNLVQIDTLAGGVDLTNAAGTLSVFATPYGSSSGTITAGDLTASDSYRVLRVNNAGPAGYHRYLTISAALTAAAALSPAPAARDRVVVVVEPGIKDVGGLASYVETSLSIPNFVSVVGTVPGSAGAGVDTGHVNVALSGTSGTLVAMADKSLLARLDFSIASPLTGATIVIGKSTGTTTANVIDVNVQAASGVGDAQTLDLVNCSAGGLYLEDVGLWRLGTATLTRHIVNSSSVGVSHYRGRLRVGTSQAVAVETTGSGIIKLWATRIDSGATCDLKSVATNSIEAYSSLYHTSCGTGTVLNGETYLFKLGSACTGACGAPNQIAFDGTNLCVCNAGTWNHIALIP